MVAVLLLLALRTIHDLISCGHSLVILKLATLVISISFIFPWVV